MMLLSRWWLSRLPMSTAISIMPSSSCTQADSCISTNLRARTWNGFASCCRRRLSRKRIVQMGYQWRYQSAMQAAVEAARNGWLGTIYRFQASIDKLVLAEERRHLAKYRGGMMFSEGCHLIDRAVAVLGKPRKVTGFLRHDSPIADGFADNNLAILEYDRGNSGDFARRLPS